MKKRLTYLPIVLLLLLIQACGGNNFQLRKSVELSPEFSAAYLKGIGSSKRFASTFTEALVEAGGKVASSEQHAQVTIDFTKFEEGRRVVAYTSERVAREYLVFLKVEYFIHTRNKKASEVEKHRLNVDRTYLYDPDFALGKAEEERRVKQTLYDEVTRLIMLRLKYAEAN